MSSDCLRCDTVDENMTLALVRTLSWAGPKPMPAGGFFAGV